MSIAPFELDGSNLLAPLPPIRRINQLNTDPDWSDPPLPAQPPIPSACPSCGCRAMVVCRNRRDTDVTCFLCGRDPRR